MEHIILYTTHCPKCNILKAKLDEKNISYKEDDDLAHMLSLGVTTVPVLSVNGSFMEFKAAVDWVNQQ